MGVLRSGGAFTARSALAALALGMAITATAATAATAAVASHAATPRHGGHSARDANAPAVTGVTWHKLTLLNGWKSVSSATGFPSWAVKGGVVYLSGALRQPIAGNNEIARLPQAAHPTRVLYITVYTHNDSTGYLIVFPDGTVDVYSANAASAQGYTSLASVSYPAATMARHKLFLVNGWASAQASDGTGDPSYSVKSGVAYLSGSAFRSSGTSTVISYLPQAAWPAHITYITVYTLNGTIGELVIEPGLGEVQAFGANVTSFISLAGVSYPVARTVVHRLVLLHGWTADRDLTNAGKPSYTVIGGVVYLAGVLHQIPGGNNEFAILPRGARPAHTLYIKTYNSSSTAVAVKIEPNGRMFALSIPSSTAQGLTSLAAISYPVNS